jgi:2-methylcitrate dehydratase MmgE/PrpD-like protein
MTEKGRITHAVVEFITSVPWHDFPAEAVDLAQRCLIDGMGVMLAGTTIRGSAVLREYIRASGGAPEATVFASDSKRALRPRRLPMPPGHAMDWNDTQLSSTPDRVFGLLTHPTMPPLAASLALSERHQRFGSVVRCGFPDGFRGGMQNG